MNNCRHLFHGNGHDPRLEVVRHHLGRNAAQISEGAGVRSDPVGQRLRPGRLGIGVAGRTQGGDEHLSNWMTAGRGIVHSERTGDEARARASTLHGIQTWLALPLQHEETDPAFFHHPGATLPSLEEQGLTVRLIAGSALGETSPVEVFSDMFYVDVEAVADQMLPIPSEYAERAVYVANGAVSIDGQTLQAGEMAILAEGAMPRIHTTDAARVMLLGGEPMDGERLMWWNLVASSQDKIDAAKARWKAGGFDPVPGETEFIPLPED